MTKKGGFRPAIIQELEARGITPTLVELGNYLDLIKLLKENEGSKKAFKPVTAYENFRWY